jgi:hypothetical protein
MDNTEKVVTPEGTDKPPLAGRFFERFRGLDRAHGHYHLSGEVSARGKVEGSGKTIHEAPTPGLWKKHLAGKYSLGIVPICNDNTASFGAIDVDVYKGLDHGEIAARCVSLELPLVVTRSKSGGAQLYLFTREPVPADLLRGKLMEWAAVLGFSGSEVFPKQVRLASKSDMGNWINMPYFKGEDTDRYAIWEGERIGPEKFLEIVEMMAPGREELERLEPRVPGDEAQWWEEAPPCLVSLTAGGRKVTEGGRNEVLFNMGVYLRKRHGLEGRLTKESQDLQTLEGQLGNYNAQFMDPPVDPRELLQIAKNLSRKEYEYTCNRGAIQTACNRQLCLTRRCGVGGDEGDPGVVFGPLQKLDTEPPIWVWEVNGRRIRLDRIEDLDSQANFRKRCMEVLNLRPRMVKPRAWDRILSDALAKVEVIPAPPEASLKGQVLELLEKYCTGFQNGRTANDLRMDKPWVCDKKGPDDPEWAVEGRTYFRGPHFHKWLESNRIRAKQEKIWAWIREAGGKDHQHRLGGQPTRFWSIPSFEVGEEWDVPSIM